MFFSVMTKNLNWEISTKNLVTFKRWDGVNDENFLNYWSTLRNLNFREGGEGAWKKTFFGGDTGAVNCRKKGLE